MVKDGKAEERNVLPSTLGELSMETRTSIALLPNCKSFADVMNLCDWVASSNVVPECYRNKPADVFVAAELGHEIGLSFMQSVQNIIVINGRPAMASDIKLALARSRKMLKSLKEASIEEIKKTGVAWCEIEREGDPAPVRHTFSVEDAKNAGLWERKGSNGYPTPWVTYKWRMLQLKPRDWCLKDKFGDLYKGLFTVEEAQEIQLIEQMNSEAAQIEQKSQPESKGQEILDKVQEQTIEAKREPVKEPERPPEQPSPKEPEEPPQSGAKDETTELEAALCESKEGMGLLRQIWTNFKLPMERIGIDGGTQYLPAGKGAFYLRALKQAMATRGTTEKK